MFVVHKTFDWSLNLWRDCSEKSSFHHVIFTLHKDFKSLIVFGGFWWHNPDNTWSITTESHDGVFDFSVRLVGGCSMSCCVTERRTAGCSLTRLVIIKGGRGCLWGRGMRRCRRRQLSSLVLQDPTSLWAPSLAAPTARHAKTCQRQLTGERSRSAKDVHPQLKITK